jgi:nicotinate-nucleotide adenylyltransferase
MRVGVFGGSFNPPHIGHLVVAEAAREAAGLDEVLWMPAFRQPLKDAGDQNIDDRLAMVRLATEDNGSFRLSTDEIDRGGDSFTIDTLRTLRKKRADDELFLIIGMDSLAEFHRWKQPAEIVKIAQLVVYRRAGWGTEPIDAQFLDHAIVIDAPQIDISSTVVRNRLLRGRSIRYLVPDRVRQYIVEKGLYVTGG